MLITDMVAEVQGRLPRLPYGAALYELRNACRDFCQRTHAWREDIDCPVVDGRLNYTLTSTKNASIESVVDVFRRSADDIAKGLDGQRIPETSWWIYREAGTVQLSLRAALTLGQATQIRVVAVIIPDSQEDDMDETLLTIHRQGFIGRAVSIFAMRQRRPWTSPTEAARGDLEWRRAIGGAISQRNSGFKDGQSYVESSS